MERLLGGISGQVGSVGEWTVEVNPGQVGVGELERLRGLGVNRLSVGVQSFCDRELRFLGRGYDPGTAERVVRAARRAGFENVSVDLIFAIPGSSLRVWEETLGRVIDLGVEHVSAYSLSYEGGTVLDERRKSGAVLPVDDAADRAMYEVAIDRLGQAGIEQYEISNFARRGFACRHNLNYWANEAYVGIGPGAGWYWQGRRGLNVLDVGGYVEAIGRGASVVAECCEVTGVDLACETAVLNLRRCAGIDFGVFERRTGYDARALFAEAMRRHEAAGLLAVTADGVRLTRGALGIADSVLCDFSAV